MGMNLLRGGLLLLCLIPAMSRAQQPTPAPEPSNEESRRACWTAELPGGKFMVPLDAITSISQSQYVVDGNARVTEVSIGTTGSVQGRFYYLEPYTPQSPLAIGQTQIDKLREKVDEVVDRVSENDPNTMVLKNYPTTTHAHTIEFRLTSLNNLKKLYSSLETALRSQKDTRFKLP